jgi:spermidine synthase
VVLIAGMTTTAKSSRRQRRRAETVERRAERRTPARRDLVVPALGVAFLLSGSAGLIHEVVWSRLLGHVFGATSLAITTVLAAYMGGLALGSWWLGRRSETLVDGRRAYAALEIAIGLAALAVPVVLAAVEPLYGALWRRYHFSFGVFSVLRFGLACAILLVPTVLMGATLPILAGYAAGLPGRRLAPPWLYTLNLAGAVLGVALAGFVLLPALGVWGTIIVGALLNIIVGAGVLLLPAAMRALPGRPTPAQSARADPLLLAIAFVSGAVSLATQIAWTRVLSLIVGSTVYAFSTVLVVYLVALGAGSAWASRRGGRVTRVVPDLALMHVLMALCTVGAVWAVNRLPHWYLGLYETWTPESLAGIVAVQVATVFAVLFWPVVCAGTILPLALVGVVPAGASDTGPAVGRIYAINTLGSIAGAMLGGFLLVPRLGSQTTLLGVALLGAVLACVLAARAPTPGWLRPAVFVTAALVVLGVALRPAWNTLALHAGVFEPGRLGSERELVDPEERLVYAREGPTASVIVIERPEDTRVLVINARANASNTPVDMATQVLLAQIPLLLAPRTEDVFIVGWGSGVTAGAALQSHVRRVTAVELEPAVVEASRWFDDANHHARLDRRVTLFEDDARHILLASEDTYDVIVSEPPHPWVAGVANLFTRDFYTLAARRLRPEGVFVQWLQSYEIAFETYRSIVATLQSVFPDVMVFNPPGSSDTILVATRQPLRIDLEALEARWRHSKTHAELARIGLETPAQLLAGLAIAPDGVRRLAEGGRINTDDNMYVEFRGPRDTIRDPYQTARETLAAMMRYHTPVEDALVDPDALLGNRVRLAALIPALRAANRPTDRYETRLRALGAEPG